MDCGSEHIFFKRAGANMRNYRQQKGLTQKEIAAKLHMAMISYNTIERGQIGTCLKTLYRIAQILEVTPARLLQSEDEIILSKKDIAELYMKGNK